MTTFQRNAKSALNSVFDRYHCSLPFYFPSDFVTLYFYDSYPSDALLCDIYDAISAIHGYVSECDCAHGLVLVIESDK